MEGAVLDGPPSSPAVEGGVPTGTHVHLPLLQCVGGSSVGERHFLIVWPIPLCGVVIIVSDADYRGEYLPPHCGVIDGQ